MLKLLKYEFRKNRTGLVVMLLIAAALFLLAPIGVALESEGLMAAPSVMLMFYGFAAYIFVLARGIGAYSGELKNRTGYLLLMTPRSTVTILFSKLIFTLFFALVMLAVCGCAFIGAGTIAIGEMQEIKGFYNIMKFTLEDYGIEVASLMYTLAFFVAELLSSLLSLVSVAYLAVTLSATVLSGKRGRGFVTFLCFMLLYGVVSAVTQWVSPAQDVLYAAMDEAMLAALPSLLVQLGFTAAFTALSGVILKKKVIL